MKRNVLFAGLIAGVVAACSEPAMEAAGDAMAGVGGAMAGVGGEIVDAGMSGVGGAVAGLGGMIAGIGGMLSAGEGGVAGTSTGGNGGGDAQAQPMEPPEPTVMMGQCNIESGYRNVYDGSNIVTENRTFYAEFDVSGVDPLDLIGAGFLLCDYESLGTAPTNACPAGVTCSRIGDPRPSADCTVYPWIELKGTTASVSCGNRSESGTLGSTTVTGYRYNSVRLVIP